MSGVNAPFGFRPVYSLGGIPGRTEMIGDEDFSGILSTYNTKMYRGSPVVLTTSGQVNIATTGAFWGIFVGCEYTDLSGIRRFRDFWPGSGVALSTSNTYAHVIRDPGQVYAVQADGAVLSTAIGDEADASNVGNGSTVNGLSSATLNSTLKGAASTGQFQILGRYRDPSNSWADAFPVILVRQNQFQAGPASVAAI